MNNKLSFFYLPSGIIAIGFIAFCLNLSNIIMISLSTFYLREILGFSEAAIGILEGWVEGFAQLMRPISGVVSDIIKKRKPILFISYILVAFSKPFIIFFQSIQAYSFSRIINRLSNGLQATPRDAFIADHASKDATGKSYGLLGSLGWAGSYVGAFLTAWLMYKNSGNYYLLFIIAVIPPFIALLILFFFISDRKKIKKTDSFSWNKILFFKNIKSQFWFYILLSSIYWFCNFAYPYLIFAVEKQGLDLRYGGASVMIVQNLGSFLFAYPIGYLADKNKQLFLFIFGFIMIIVANLTFISEFKLFSIPIGLYGILCWGIQMSVVQSLLRKKIADNIIPELRGTGFGIYYIINGITLFITNYIFAVIWKWNWKYIFILSSFYAILAIILICVYFYIQSRKRYDKN